MRSNLAGQVIRLMLVLAVVAAVVLTAVTRASEARAIADASANRPVQTRSDGYVSSQQCRACHPAEYESWHHSYHRTMTQVASAESVVGNFDGADLVLDDETYGLRRLGDVFWLETRPPIGSGTLRQKVSLVTGSHHMQVYWYESAVTRWVGLVPFAYLIEDQRWVPRRATFLRPPEMTGNSELGRWNASCVNCHTTHGQPRIEVQNADTHVAEFGIACEACHGPAEAHVRANTIPVRRYAQHFDDKPDQTIVQPANLTHEKSSEICSHCHALWQAQDGPAQQRAIMHGHAFRPGGEHREQWLFQPSRRDGNPAIARIIRDMPEYVDGQFWRDGMSRASSREYHGMIDSGCYKDGEMSCLSCHAMHKKADDPRPWSEWSNDQLGVGMDGDQACTQCHGAIGAAIEKHTFHAKSSQGSRCYNCHMPYTAYGLLKAIRSHGISAPDVASTVKHGRPNACNLCHLDRTLDWAAKELQAKWGIAPPVRDPAQLADYAGTPVAALWALKGDASQRALVAWHMGWAPAREAARGGWFPPLLAELLDDPYDAVRIVARRALSKHAGFEDFAYDPIPRPALRDPVSPRVVARWQETRASDVRGPAPVFTASNERDEAAFARLLRERDQRPVHLLE